MNFYNLQNDESLIQTIRTEISCHYLVFRFFNQLVINIHVKFKNENNGQIMEMSLGALLSSKYI